MREITFSVLEHAVALRAQCDEATVASLLTQTATYAPAQRTPDLVYEFPAGPPHRILRDGNLLHESEDPLDLPPIFERDLYDVLLRRCAGWALHAASLSEGGGALLLAGDSGSGKSTMSLAMLGRGFRYFADDSTVLDAQGSVSGIRRPLSFDRPPAEIPAGAALRSYPMMLKEGGLGDALLVHPPPEALADEPVPARLIVRLRHAPQTAPASRRLTPGEALAELWPLSHKRGAEAWAIALSAVKRTPIFELSTRRLDEACDDLLALWRSV